MHSTSHQGSSMKFSAWANLHGKTYESDAERVYRHKIYSENVALIEAHNQDSTQTYEMGINQFTDLTKAEFTTRYLTLKVNKRFERTVSMKDTPVVGDVDWVAAGKVSPVKNQGACGSCWAFSATASIEAAYLINKQTVSLSEQELVDCSGAYGNQGCNGGWMDSAFQYIIDHNINSDADYHYTARTEACKGIKGSFRISGFVDVQGCDNLANALTQQPVSVAVDASNWSPYRSGVFSNCATAVNHGVLAVGFVTGTTPQNGWWNIKNSWGASWGESGFIRLARGNTCAICNYPSFPRL